MKKLLLSPLSGLIMLNIYMNASANPNLDITQLKPIQTFASSETLKIVTPNLSQPLSINGDQAHEHYDPVSGNLKLIYNDIVLPGDGDLPIVIRRLYDHLNPAGRDNLAVQQNRFHSRWDVGMNIPLLIAPNSFHGKPDNTTFLKNLSLRLPNGEVTKLIIKKVNPGVSLVTSNNWKVYLEYHAPTLTARITSPTGTFYYYEEPVTSDGHVKFQNGGLIKFMRDKHGNQINFSYLGDRLKQIKASDGRVVNVNYSQEAGSHVMRFNANGKTWKYYFNTAEITNWGYTYQLTKVVRPDNKTWGYSYDTRVNYAAYNQIHFSINLNEVTSPLGLKTRYTFGDEHGVSAVLPPEVNNPLMNKQVFLTSNKHYDWAYFYKTGAAGSNMGNTTIQGPKRISKYNYRVAFLGNDFVDHTTYALQYYGLIEDLQLFDQAGQLLKKEHFDYPTSMSRRIAVTDKKYLTCVFDHLNRGDASKHCTFSYDAALLAAHSITLPSQGTYTTRYSQYDSFGRPHHIEETGDNNKQRMIDLTYFTNLNKNIFGGVAIKKVNNHLVENNQFDNNHLGDIVTHTKNGITHTFQYYANGNLKTDTDGDQHATKYENYKLGTAQSITYANNTQTTQQVNADGLVVAATDANKHSTSYQYDELNRLAQITDPKDYVTTLNYDDKLAGSGGYSKIQDNLRIVSKVDQLGREIEIDKTDLNTHTTYKQIKTYDELNRLVFKSYFFTAPQGNLTAGQYYQYDSLNRLIANCAPYKTSVCSTYAYQPGHTVAMTNPKGQTTLTTLQSYGNPTEASIIKTQQPEGITTEIERDEFGHILTVKQGSLVRRYQYSPTTFLLTSLTDPEVGTTEFDYDHAGNLKTKTKSDLTTTYHYDSVNQLIKTEYSDGAATLHKTYYPGGQLKTVSKGSIEEHYSYDANNNLTEENFSINSEAFKLQYAYDTQNVLQQITYPNKQVITYAPNAFGQATQVGNYINAIQHYPSGIIKSMQAGNNVVTTTELNQRLLPKTLKINTSSGALTRVYHFDDNNNITQIENVEDPGYNLTLAYDNVNRLITANGKWGQGKIKYNINGNIMYKKIGAHTLTYNMENNGLLHAVNGSLNRTFTYDALGNVVNNGQQQFHYLLDGNLTELKDKNANLIARYQYDGNGQRLVVNAKGEHIYSLYNLAGTLLFRQKGNQTTDYFYLKGHKVAQLEKKADGNIVTYFHNNLLGSPIAATDVNGTLLWQQYYQPFGNHLNKNIHSNNQQWYNGKVEDNESELMYYGARYYDATIGRFMAVDPVGFNSKQPVSFNRYAYANNNPYLFVDPTGLWSVELSWNKGDWAVGVNTDNHGFIGLAQQVFDSYTKITTDFWNNATLGLIGEDDGKTHNYSVNLSVTGGYGHTASYGVSVTKIGVSFYNAYGYGLGFNVNASVSKTFGHTPTGFHSGLTIAEGMGINLASTTGLSQNGAYETISVGAGGGSYAGSMFGYSSKTYSWAGIGNGAISVFKQITSPIQVSNFNKEQQ